MKGRLRPQILVSLILLGSLAILSMTKGMVEITTGCITLIVVVSIKIIDSE